MAAVIVAHQARMVPNLGHGGQPLAVLSDRVDSAQAAAELAHSPSRSSTPGGFSVFCGSRDLVTRGVLPCDSRSNTTLKRRAASRPVAPDPSAPDLGFLTRETAAALQSFFDTIDRIVADNPVAIGAAAGAGRQGAVGAAHRRGSRRSCRRSSCRRSVRAARSAPSIGFFLKLKPYPMLEEIRRKGKVFQPPFGPVLVVDGAAVRDVLERDQEFTVEPYGVEMMKVMSPPHNGGFSTFVLSTDDNAVYEPDKRLLSAVCNRQDADAITERRFTRTACGASARPWRPRGRAARRRSTSCRRVARYVPVTLGHRYLGVPVAAQPGIVRADRRRC